MRSAGNQRWLRKEEREEDEAGLSFPPPLPSSASPPSFGRGFLAACFLHRGRRLPPLVSGCREGKEEGSAEQREREGGRGALLGHGKGRRKEGRRRYERGKRERGIRP